MKIALVKPMELEICDSIIKDRDRWKVRAEALERAIRQATSSRCRFCQRGRKGFDVYPGAVVFGFECDDCETGGWEFDEARFMEGAE